jgi:dimethylhistidine N-methyltransferase
MSSLIHTKPSFTLYDLHPPIEDFRAAILAGLSQPEKSVSPQFLYDKRGAELFGQICQLEEYYLTRTETQILQRYAIEIANYLRDGILIEFGSGSSQKVRTFLDVMDPLPTYVALDISKQHLVESCVNLAEAYPGLEAIAICTDYTQPVQLPAPLAHLNKPKIAFFPGSSIGNLEPEAAIGFLKNVAALVHPQGGLLIGVDLKKDKAILEPAYADAKGVSAAFALNLLTRINRELDADFDLNQFEYEAFYAPEGRIEMYIVSRKDQMVHIGANEIRFGQGERLRTEYSYKYGIAEFQEMAVMAGFYPKQVWTDPQQLFSVHYLGI